MGFIKTIILLSVGIAIGYYFGVGNSWGNAMQAIGL